MDRVLGIAIIAASLMVLAVGSVWLEKNPPSFLGGHSITIQTK